MSVSSGVRWIHRWIYTQTMPKLLYHPQMQHVKTSSNVYFVVSLFHIFMYGGPQLPNSEVFEVLCVGVNACNTVRASMYSHGSHCHAMG